MRSTRMRACLLVGLALHVHVLVVKFSNKEIKEIESKHRDQSRY